MLYLYFSWAHELLCVLHLCSKWETQNFMQSAWRQILVKIWQFNKTSKEVRLWLASCSGALTTALEYRRSNDSTLSMALPWWCFHNGSYWAMGHECDKYTVHNTENVTLLMFTKEYCGWQSSKSRVFRARLCMRPTFTETLWFTYERLLHVTFCAANSS